MYLVPPPVGAPPYSLAKSPDASYTYVVVRADAKDAYVAANGKTLGDKAVRIEVARPKRR